MTPNLMDNHKIDRWDGTTGTERGFSLIEVAVVMFIIVLLLGSILIPLTTQVEQRQISDTQKQMEDIKEALIGFAIANSYLPCPDSVGNDGVSDPNAAGPCTNAFGNIPWATLNMPRGDAWGNRFRYRVAPEFTNTPATGDCLTNDGRLGLCDTGNITINKVNDKAKKCKAHKSMAAGET